MVPTDYVQYQTGLITHVLRKSSQAHFITVIDIGCGATGRVLRAVAQKVGAKRAKGIDLRVCDELQGSIVLHRGNFLEETPEEQYELVLSNQVFEHIYELWLPKYFDSLKASCAPGGVILLSTPNRWRPKNILRVLTFRRPEMMNSNMGIPPEQHLGHHRECSWRELYAFINQYFQKPEWSICIVRLVPRPKGSLAHWLGNLLIYFLFWPFWRLLVVSASQDHYAVIQRSMK